MKAGGSSSASYFTDRFSACPLSDVDDAEGPGNERGQDC